MTMTTNPHSHPHLPPSLRDWQMQLKDMFWNWTRICEVTAIKKNILYYYNLQVSIAQTVIINI